MLKVVHINDRGNIEDPFIYCTRFIMEDEGISEELYNFLEKEIIDYIKINIISLYNPKPIIKYHEGLKILRLELIINVPHAFPNQNPPIFLTQDEIKLNDNKFNKDLNGLFEFYENLKTQFK